MTRSEVLHRFEQGEGDGVEVHVVTVGERFGVQVFDVDSAQYLPSSSLWPTEGQAVEDAKEIAGIKEPGE